MLCQVCRGRGRVRGPSGWIRCRCQIPDRQADKLACRERYLSCSARYARGETGIENIQAALSGALRYYTDRDLAVIGSLTIEQIQNLKCAQVTLDIDT